MINKTTKLYNLKETVSCVTIILALLLEQSLIISEMWIFLLMRICPLHIDSVSGKYNELVEDVIMHVYSADNSFGWFKIY